MQDHVVSFGKGRIGKEISRRDGDRAGQPRSLDFLGRQVAYEGLVVDCGIALHSSMGIAPEPPPTSSRAWWWASVGNASAIARPVKVEMECMASQNRPSIVGSSASYTVSW